MLSLTRMLRAFRTLLCAAGAFAWIGAQASGTQNAESARRYFEEAVRHDRGGQSDKAVAEYSEAIRLDPRYVDAYLERAAIYLRQGKNNRAFYDYAQAIHSAPTDYKPYYDVGEAYWRLGDKVSALSIFRKCMTMDVRDPSSLIAMGDRFLSEGLYQDAISDYSWALKLASDSGSKEAAQWIETAHLRRAAAKRKSGENAGALQDLNQAAQYAPGSAAVLTARGKLYFQMRADAAAARDLDIAIQLTPQSAEARLARSQLRAEARQYQAAMEDLDAAIRYSPKMSEAYDMRGLLWAYGFSNYDKAADDLSSALAIAPENPQIHFDLASVRILRKEFQKAISALTSALKLGAPPSPILERRAKAFAVLGNFTAAFKDIRSALERDPDVGSMHIALGAIELLSYDFDQAINDMEAAEQAGLKSADVFMTLGTAYAAKGNLSKGMKEFKRAVRLNPQSSEAYRLLCRAQRLDGEAGSALSACETAIRLDSKDGSAFIDRGLTQLVLEHYEAALSDLNKARQMGARYAEGELARSIAYAGLGQWQESDEAYRSALNLDPRVRKPELNFNPGLQTGKDYSDFIHAFEGKIKRSKDNSYSFLVRGNSYANAGNPSLALAEYTKALHAKEPVFAAFLDRCIALAGQRSFNAAEQSCLRALELAPNEPAVYVQLLKVLEQRHDYGSGTKEAAIALQSARKSPDLYVQAGNFLYFVYDAPGAERNYAAALSIDPRSADAYIGLGICRLVKKQYDDAAENFTHAILINDHNVDYYLHRAAAYAGNGDYANASTNYKIALAVNRDPAATAQIAKLRQDAVGRMESSLKSPINVPKDQ